MDEQITAHQSLIFLRALVPLIAALGAYLFLRRNKDGRFYPLLVGWLTYFFLAAPRMLLRASVAFHWDSFAVNLFLTQTVTAVLEEPCRYLAQRYAMKKYDTLSDALCAGIGNGCMELFIWAFLQSVFAANSLHGWLTPGLLNADIFEIYPEARIPEELLRRGIEAQGGLRALDFIIGGICLLAFHMAMSALIQVAVQRTNSRQFLIAAILLHLFYNILWAICGTAVILPITAAICYFVYRIRQVHYRIEPDTIITIRMIFIPFK